MIDWQWGWVAVRVRQNKQKHAKIIIPVTKPPHNTLMLHHQHRFGAKIDENEEKVTLDTTIRQCPETWKRCCPQLSSANEVGSPLYPPPIASTRCQCENKSPPINDYQFSTGL